MARKRKGNPVSGWVILDKPFSLGSTPSVGRVRRLFSAQKAGHAGTLDPLATGILPIALGEATKTVSFLMDAQKNYEFTLTFGENTDTLDKEGKVISISEVRPTAEAIKGQLKNFIGAIFSATRIARAFQFLCNSSQPSGLCMAFFLATSSDPADCKDSTQSRRYCSK